MPGRIARTWIYTTTWRAGRSSSGTRYPLEALVPTTDHDKEDDFRLFACPAHPPLSLLMRAGTFAPFFPQAAHVPMVTDGVHSSYCMIVFKIRCGLFEQQVAALAK